MEEQEPFESWTPVIGHAELLEEHAVRVTVGAVDLFLYRSGERLFALDNRCTHMSGPLHRGRVNARVPQPTVTCPVHGSMFWMTDGRVVRGPAAHSQPMFDARVNDGMIEVRRRNGAAPR
jgi:nitrite reductase/ring-hydroxylating ferredoxin subunit